MSTVEEIERAIAKLSEKELTELRQLLWDRDIEQDIKNGRLDSFAEEAVRAHRASKTKRL